MLVGRSVSMEVVGRHILGSSCDVLKDRQPLDTSLVYVSILELRWVDELLVSLLCDFLLEHLLLLLVLLDTDVHVVDQSVPIDHIR